MNTFKSRLLSIFFLVCLLAGLPVPQAQAQEGTVIFVKWDAPGPTHDGSSWNNAYTDLQTALAAASGGREIWVAQGTYKPVTSAPDPRTATFNLNQNVKLFGGFAGTEFDLSERNLSAHITTLSGDIGTVGNSADNVYHVVTSTNYDGLTSLDGLTITGGKADNPVFIEAGGGLFQGFDVVTHPTRYLTLTNVTFDNNSSSSNGGGLYVHEGTVTLERVTFANNSAAMGGGMAIAGIDATAINVTLTNVTFENNTCSGSGGAVVLYSGILTISGSTFTANTAIFKGGGISTGGSSYGGTLTVSNSTFYNNTSGEGGGISIGTNTTATVFNSTFSHNSATWGAGILHRGENLILKNSILANSISGEDCMINNSSSSFSGSHNLIEITGSASLACGTPLLTSDPKLDPLQDNGGVTQTMALLYDSPAFDAGDDGVCPDLDQRGTERPQGLHCDIGAFELIVPYPMLATPANNETLLHRRPTFDWSNVSDASSYRILASRSNTFSTLLWNVDTTTSSYTPPADLPAGKVIYWKVRARVNGVWSPWSETWSFRTAKPPSVPVLVAPANKTITKNYTPLLDWNDSTIPSGGVAFDHYQVQVATEKTFASPVVNDVTPTGEITASFHTPATDLAANSKYFWRVRSFNADGQYSSWSTVWSFSTALLPPANLTPTDGESVPTRKPLLDWDAVEGATGYDLQISTSDSFVTLLVNTPVTADTFTPSIRLPANKIIYWRVRATGTNGPSRWTTASFRTP